jgi:hypothetical protein
MHEGEKPLKCECPVCFKRIKMNDLSIDGFFEEILANVSSEAESIQVEIDGTWKEPKAKSPALSRTSARGLNSILNPVKLDSSPPRKSN